MRDAWDRLRGMAAEQGFSLVGCTTPLPGDGSVSDADCRVLVLAMPYRDAPDIAPPGLHISAYYFRENQAYHAGRALLANMAAADPTLRAYEGREAKAYARRAGLGQFGRNDLIQAPELGSRFTLQLFCTALPFPVTGEYGDIRALAPACAGCARCVAACPTGALDGGGPLDRAKCLRHWMFQTRAPVPEPLRTIMGNRLLGCEDCQRACPQNASLPREPIPPLMPFQKLSHWLCDAETFTRRQRPLGELLGHNYIRPLRLRCQLALLMGNLGGAECLPTLGRWTEAKEEILTTTAHWAMDRIRAREEAPC